MNKGAWFVVLATTGLALKGIWARLAYAQGADVSDVLFYRCLLSAPLLAWGGWYFSRQKVGSANAPRPTRASWLHGVGLGLLFSLCMTCDFQAIAFLGASVSRVVLFGFPLVVMALDAVVMRRAPSRAQLLGFGIAWLGLSALAAGGQGQAAGVPPVTPVAVGWGLGALFIYATYVWLAGPVSRALGSARLTMVSQLSNGATVALFVLFRSGGHMPEVSGSALGWIGALVLVSTVVPYFLMMEGIRRLGSSEASLLAMGGPVVTVTAGWIVLGEAMSLVQLVGTVLVLGGVAWSKGAGFSRVQGRVLALLRGAPKRFV